MSAGWFALGGVIIGGTLNGLVTWMLGRRGHWDDARVAALQVLEEVTASLHPLSWAAAEREWRFLHVRRFASRSDWDENRATLGRVLPPHGYISIAATHRELTSLSQLLAHRAPEAKIDADDDYVRVKTAELAAQRSAAYLRTLIFRPPMWKWRARRTFDRDHQKQIDELIDQDRVLHGITLEDETD